VALKTSRIIDLKAPEALLRVYVDPALLGTVLDAAMGPRHILHDVNHHLIVTGTGFIIITTEQINHSIGVNVVGGSESHTVPYRKHTGTIGQGTD
jgi:hypothetical protein